MEQTERFINTLHSERQDFTYSVKVNGDLLTRQDRYTPTTVYLFTVTTLSSYPIPNYPFSSS